MKKTISGLLALCLLLGLCVGCGNSDKTPDQSGDPTQTDEPNQSGASGQMPISGNIYTDLLGIDPNETALESDGNQIPMELYLYWLTYSCSSLEYQLNMFSAYYGMYGELLNEDGTVKWDGDLEGTTVSEMAKEQAESSALSYAILENVAAKYNVTLTEDDRAQMAEDEAAYIEQLGGEEAFQQNLIEMGISKESFDRVSASSYLYQHLAELAQDPASELYQAPTDDDAYVDHILLMTKDSETYEDLSEEEVEAKRAQAEELLAQLQAADPADLESLFTQLADENGEDPGREAETGYLINPETSFVQEFLDAAFALQPGEISGIVESDYGYHILMRKELTESQMATVAEEHLADFLDEQMAAAQENVVRSEKLESIDVASFFTDYCAAVEAMYPAEDDAQPADDDAQDAE